MGLAKVFQVSAGDRIELEVFARYSSGVGSNNTLIPSIVSVVTGAFGLGSGEAPYTTFSNNLGGIAGGISRNGSASKAYLFYILLDASYNYYGQFGYASITTGASVDFERLYLDVNVPQGGFLYTYVANESAAFTSASVYFDDFSVVHTRNTNALQVVQVQDYYPFGVSFDSYSGQNSVSQHYKYNSKEEQNEFGLYWLDFGARMYMPEIGRWGVIDPHADRYNMVSPFNYVFNSPINAIDPDGRDAIFTVTRNKRGEITGVTVSATVYITGAGASEERANELNDNSSSVFKGKTIKGNVNVKVDIKYKYKEKVNTKDLKGGENILTFVDKPSTHEDRSHVRGYQIGATKFTGRVGVIYKDDWENDRTVYHESLHFTGLPDMYYWDGTPIEGFEDDIMGNRSDKIGYDHHKAYLDRAQEVVNDPSKGKKFEKGFINRKAFNAKEASEEQKKGL